ncbi:MAG: hypothetical protein FWH11_10595 [Micrococcales bacterium]|nr:hypothetical protein [Micrococcales bacterium]
MSKHRTDAEALAALEAIDPATAVVHDRSDVAGVAAAVAARGAAEDLVLAAVREARTRDVSWVMIAWALGVTPQAAHKKYRHLVEQVPA